MAAAILLLNHPMPPAWAARPLVGDDAALLEPGQCQLESWMLDRPDGNAYWVVPACNFSGNLEVALGGARIRADGRTARIAVLQGKTLFKPLETNGWGAGLLVGYQASSGSGAESYAAIPVSFSFRDDRLVTHINLGFVHGHGPGRTMGTWSLAAEGALTPRTALVAETFGQHRGKPFVQLGIRHWLLADRVQLDATYGARVGSGRAERFITIGLVLFSGSQQ